MTFQEKTRWAALAANVLVWVWYFASVFSAWRSGALTGTNSLSGVLFAIIASVVVQVIITIAIAAHRPGDADPPLDERDRQIAQKGSAAAYPLLSFGLVLVIGAAYFAVDYLVAINLLLLVFIATECIRYLIEIAAYRQGRT